MCYSEKWGPVFLKVVNVIFMLFGLALIIPGVLVIVNVDVINEKVLPLMRQLTFGGINLGDAALGLSIALIITGAIVLSISLLGLIGACCRKPACLDIYAGIVLILFIAKLIAVFLWFDMNSKLQSWMKTELTTQLNKYAANDLTSHEISTAWNYLFILMSCCAVNSVNGTINDFDTSSWITSGSAGTKQIPTFCCTGVTASSYSSHIDSTCTDSVTANYYTTGCYDAVYNALSTYSIVFIVVGACIMLIEMLAVVAATSMNYASNSRYTSKVEESEKT